MRKLLSTLIAALLSGSVSLMPGPAMAEDLIQIYDLAVRSDPVLREAEQTLFATREVKPQARALLLPNIAVTGTADYNNLHSSGSSRPKPKRSGRRISQLRPANVKEMTSRPGSRTKA